MHAVKHVYREKRVRATFKKTLMRVVCPLMATAFLCENLSSS